MGPGRRLASGQQLERFLPEEWAANLATFEKRLIGSLD